jgi:hypothetical protein
MWPLPTVGKTSSMCHSQTGQNLSQVPQNNPVVGHVVRADSLNKNGPGPHTLLQPDWLPTTNKASQLDCDCYSLLQRRSV